MPLTKSQSFRRLIRNLRTQNVPALAQIQTHPRGKWLMNKEEVAVGQVFKDGDWRVANPFFTVKDIKAGKASGTRSVDIEGTKAKDGKPPIKVSISLERLIKTGTRGYTMVKGVNLTAPQPAPETTPV